MRSESIALLCGFLLTIAPAFGETAPTVPDELVRQLGSRSYIAREKASRQLMGLGRNAVPSLEQGMKADDPEVARRCRELLPLARRTDAEIRLDAFLTDPNKSLDLPGWSRFQKLMGDEPAARVLFASLYRAQGTLFEQLESKPEASIASFSEQCRSLQNRLYMPQAGKKTTPVTPAEVFGLLFATSDPRLKITSGVDSILYSSLYHQVVSTAIQNDPIMLKFLCAIVETTPNAYALGMMIGPLSNMNLPDAENQYIRPNVIRLLTMLGDAPQDTRAVPMALQFASRWQLREGLPLAKWIMQQPNRQPYVCAQAIPLLVKFEAKEFIPTLEKLLTDKTSLGGVATANVRVNLQVCDVALGGLILLTKQSLTDYDFPWLKAFPNQNLQLGNANLGFTDDTDRAAAQKKWREWAAKHLPPPSY